MSKKLSLAIKVAVAASLTLGAVEASAYETGDIIFRAGFAQVAPDDSSSVLTGSSAITALNIGSTPNTGASVDNANALGLTLTYMLRPHIGIELLAATPFEHDLKANLTGLGLGIGTVNAGKVKQLPPTLSLQWYPMETSSAFQPYVGAGINYTIFFSEDVDPQLEAAIGAAADALLPASGTTVKGEMQLESSWGLSAQAGFDYAINDNWVVNAAVWYIDIDTDANIKFDLPDGTRAINVSADVEVDPMVYMVSLGYKF